MHSNRTKLLPHGMVAGRTFLSPAERNTINMADRTFAALAVAGPDLKIAQAALARPDQPIRRLYCCCCGASFQGRQFHNQDLGHGMGECCAERVLNHKPFGHDAMSLAEFERTYGIRGYHFAIPADVVALDEFVTKAQDINGFDYARQAWVIKGRYIKCGHLPEHNCTCYGKMHEGELISPESLQDIGL